MWSFLQNEVLGMQWLNRLMGSIVEAVGLDPKSPIGGSIQFFFYDVPKIMVLLGLVIAVLSGTIIEKLHMQEQVEEFIRKGGAIDRPQEELHFADRIRYGWEQVRFLSCNCHFSHLIWR